MSELDGPGEVAAVQPGLLAAPQTTPAAPEKPQQNSQAPAELAAGRPAVQCAPQATENGAAPGSASPQEPGTPSAESKEPAGPSGAGSAADEPVTVAATAPAAAVQQAPPQPAAQQPKTARGRRPKSAAAPAQVPRARPSRASAVAAAGFLAKVIGAEIGPVDVSELRRVRWRALFGLTASFGRSCEAFPLS